MGFVKRMGRILQPAAWNQVIMHGREERLSAAASMQGAAGGGCVPLVMMQLMPWMSAITGISLAMAAI